MPLQDLTPQLRTRLNRMERGVGWFIMVATLLLLFGFGYYLRYAADQRGWFKAKAKFFTYATSGNGLHVGDAVEMMGFDVGHIIGITAMPPKWHEQTSDNVYITFEVFEPNFGYLWTEGTHVELNSSGLLDKRELDVTKGSGGYAIYLTQKFRDDLTVAEAEALPDLGDWRLGQEFWDGTNLSVRAWQPLSADVLKKISERLGTNRVRMIDPRSKGSKLTAIWNPDLHGYVPYVGTNIYGLERQEQVALGDRLQAMVAQVQAALPGILQMTNQIAYVLSNTTQLTSNLNIIAKSAQPTVTNLAAISDHLREPGSLGKWLIPTNINEHLDTTLQTANGTLTNLNTNLVTLNLTLDNLANITSNLNNQVQANTNLLTNISDIVVHTDQFIQGLKRFWLFRHLFPTHPVKKAPASTSAPARQQEPALSPKEKGQ
jgi:hypothetical protein